MEISKAHNLIASCIRQGSYLGLDRMRCLMAYLGNPQDKLKYVHVAGTNGKGSTASMLSSVLRVAGLRTGLYTSPALCSFNERMRVNGAPIGDRELEHIAKKVEAAAKKLPDDGHEYPSEFEFVTAMAFLWFYEQNCEIVVLEVGLGGRLDATNIIKTPLASVICAIGLDHTAELGSTHAQIAAEKAEIIKGGYTVSFGGEEEADAVIAKKCKEVGSVLISPDFKRITLYESTIDGQKFSYNSDETYKIRLLGEHQLKNAAVVLETVGALRLSGLKIDENAVKEGLEKAVWHARLEVISKDPIVLLDGAHNPHGIRALANSLGNISDRWIFMCGILADKSYGEMLEIISPLAAEFITSDVPSPRSLKSSALADIIMNAGYKATDGGEVEDAVATALQKQKETGLPLCIFGSLYMAGTVLGYFKIEGV